MQADTECYLPQGDQRYLEEHGLSVCSASEGNEKGVILSKFPLPAGKFQVDHAEVLIIVPAGYPDVPPDMFYVDPWLTLATTGRHPERADQAKAFAGRRWQRWSRHNKEWRPGVDALRTHIRRVIKALEDAK